MNKRNPIFRVFAEFHRRLAPLKGEVVIAGGAVRDALRGVEPKDYDVFVLGHPWSEASKAETLALLANLPVVVPFAWHNSEPYLVGTVDFRGRLVQVMLNPAGTVNELLDTFDWNTCLFAYDGREFHQRTQLDELQPGRELRLQTVTFPLSTLRRGYRFSERFSMIFTLADQMRLVEAIMAKRSVLTGALGATPDMPALAANHLIEEGGG